MASRVYVRTNKRRKNGSILTPPTLLTPMVNMARSSFIPWARLLSRALLTLLLSRPQPRPPGPQQQHLSPPRVSRRETYTATASWHITLTQGCPHGRDGAFGRTGHRPPSTGSEPDPTRHPPAPSRSQAQCECHSTRRTLTTETNSRSPPKAVERMPSTSEYASEPAQQTLRPQISVPLAFASS